MEKGCDYYFAVDSIAMFDSQSVLKNLMKIKRYTLNCTPL